MFINSYNNTFALRDTFNMCFMQQNIVLNPIYRHLKKRKLNLIRFYINTAATEFNC